MIVKNNYYWTERMMADGDMDSYSDFPSFIANGDIAVIRRVRRQRELYGFRFEDAVLSFPDYDDLEMEVTLLLDTLHSESPSLTREESDRLFNSVMEDYADIRSKKKKMEQLRENPHFNALQIKYAYAVTCHKAQGGQWKNIFIDQGYIPEGGRDEDYYRWLYTALTRATQTVYLVNWPDQ
jgi:exodeoxyribonuclease-5